MAGRAINRKIERQRLRIGAQTTAKDHPFQDGFSESCHDLDPGPDHLPSCGTKRSGLRSGAGGSGHSLVPEKWSERARLQTGRMPRFKAKRHALGRLPARRPTAGGVVWRSCVQAKAGDHGEGMTASSIDRDPFPRSATTVTAQVSRTQRCGNKAGARQCVGNSSGAVIAAVIEGAMAAAVSIRFRAQLVARPSGALDRERRVHRRQS